MNLEDQVEDLRNALAGAQSTINHLCKENDLLTELVTALAKQADGLSKRIDDLARQVQNTAS